MLFKLISSVPNILDILKPCWKIVVDCLRFSRVSCRILVFLSRMLSFEIS